MPANVYNLFVYTMYVMKVSFETTCKKIVIRQYFRQGYCLVNKSLGKRHTIRLLLALPNPNLHVRYWEYRKPVLFPVD